MDHLFPPLEARRRFVQMTSYDRGPLPLPGRWGDWSRKCVTLIPGDEHVAADHRGPGIITRIFVTLPTSWNRALFRQIRIRVRWDDEETASVDVPLGDFFGIHHCTYRQYSSRLFSVVSGGLVCTVPMPFSTGFELTFTQEGRLPVPMFFYGVGFYEVDADAVDPLRFHAAWRREPMTREGAPFEFLNARGEGVYVGMHLSTQNRHRFWLSTPDRWLYPAGFGLGHLEGWEEIFVDDEPSSSHVGTGHEEYFNTGWYFLDGRFVAPDFGCLHRSRASGRTASYRYHWLDPIPFRRSLRGIMHRGVHDNIPADYCATAYWYQREPHGPRPQLPPVHERRNIPVVGSRVRCCN